MERGANELRVYLRSWCVTHTATNTRIDVDDRRPGDESLPRLLRQALTATVLPSSSVGSNRAPREPERWRRSDLALMGRLGWAKGPWSLDAFADPIQPPRDEQDPQLRR